MAQLRTPEIQLVDYQSSDIEILHSIFFQSVHGIGIVAYTKEQCKAWAPADFDSYYWGMRLKNLKTIFAVINEQKVGFISYRNDGYIDFLYVLPEWKGKGIAQSMFNQVEFELLSRPAVFKLTTDASHIAKPFFEKNGFKAIKKNEIPLRGETLVNFSMEKSLLHLS
ncbi:GNAT family N-acetyltransferase [bacterium]|nr:MAG: GNAT family N-acetyltransferase [bacterium]